MNASQVLISSIGWIAEEDPGKRSIRDRIWETLGDMGPVIGAALAVVLLLSVTHFLLGKRASRKNDSGFGHQLTMFLLTLLGIVLVILALPVTEAMQAQLLSLFGLLLSAAIALSSTTILGNMMAGLMLRALRSFKTGDFIRCGEDFGRVTERGLLHTELQTEDSDLTTLPNLRLVTTPYSVIRAKGTIVTASVSLGYDISRTEIEAHLLQAAEDAGLEKGFVQVLELGDFSVVYRVGGMLTSVKQLLSTRSLLRGRVMDRLHEGGLEIASPTLMSTRAYRNTETFVPEQDASASAAELASLQNDTPRLDDLAFEKADKAASVEELVTRVAKTKDELLNAQETHRKAKGVSEKADCARDASMLEIRLERQELLLEHRQQEMTQGEDE
ncbi:MAG: small conductance mechanosensitive channel [Planctomycetota bacterium]|jgi:small conductance mechanosensitive channel